MKNYKLQPNQIQLIDVSNKATIFFHTEALQIYPLSKKNDIAKFLEVFKENGYKKTKQIYQKEDFNQLYKFICDKILSAPKSSFSKVEDMDKEYYRAIVLPIAAMCNLNCPYCFAQTDGGFHFKNFTEKDIEKVADFLINQNDKSQAFNICFFGGEPLLKFDIIKFTIKHFKEKYPDRKVTYSITTNGTILNEEIIQIFKENNFAILLSIDGYDNEFNLRKFKDGSKSVHRVLENIEWFKKESIGIEIRATLVNENPYIYETFKFFEELNIPFNLVFAYSSANKIHHYANYNKENLERIRIQLDNLLDFYVERVNNNQPIYNNTFNVFSRTLRFRNIRGISCSAGLNYFTITANGDIFSCAHFINDKKYAIGNITDGIIDKSKYIPVDISNIDECKECWIKYLCTGGCFAQKISYEKSNNTAQDNNKCELDKIVWTFYIKLYYNIMRINPKFFNKK